jgi:hypothetical protein
MRTKRSSDPEPTSMTRADPTFVFLNRMDRYRTTSDAWMFFIKCYYQRLSDRILSFPE